MWCVTDLLWTLRLPAGYSLGAPEQKNYTIRIDSLPDAPSELKSVESLLFHNRPFTEAHEGRNEIVSPSERRDLRSPLPSALCAFKPAYIFVLLKPPKPEAIP